MKWFKVFVKNITQNNCHCVKIPDYRFSLTRIFPHKIRIYDSVLIRENKSQRKPVFWHTSCSVFHESPLLLVITSLYIMYLFKQAPFIFTKRFILDVSQGSKYASNTCPENLLITICAQ